MLASILSSAGTLVELQAPCLSDSVLALLLDYIYTGALPYTHSLQQYSRLLTAACYLQMDELQESLRTAMNPADNRNESTETENKSYKDINNTYTITANTFSKYLQLSDTCSVNSLERARQYLGETDTRSSSSGKNSSPLSIVSTSCSVSESTVHSVNTSNCRQVTCRTSRDLIQSIPCAAEVHRESRVDKEVQNDEFHSAAPVKQISLQMSTDEKCENRRRLYLLHTAEVQEEETSRSECWQGTHLPGTSESEGKQTNRNKEGKIHHSPLPCLSTSHLKDNVAPLPCFLSPSPSSPHPCCGAVPVIRHSSTAAISEVSTVPLSHPVSSPSVSSDRTADSQSGNTDNGRFDEDITTTHRNHYGAQNQDYRNNKDRNGTPNWDYKEITDQCAVQDLCYKSNADQYGILKQDYNSNNTDHDEHMDNRLSHMRDDNVYHAHCDLFQNHTRHFRDDSMPPNKDCGSFPRGLESKTDPDFDDFPSKHEKLNCPDCRDDLMTTVTEEQSSHSQDPNAAVPLLFPESDTGSVSHYEDLCPEGGAKEEHSYTSRCTAEVDRQHSLSNSNGPKNDWYPSLHRAEKNTKDAVFIQHGRDDRDTAIDNVSGHNSLENENILDTESSEPHLTLTKPVHNVSYPACNVVGQSYRGHLNYHCLPQEDTHLSHRHSDHKHSHPNLPDYLDQASDEEGDGAFASPAVSPLRQHFAGTDQVLLLDISTKPAELLVSYRSDVQEKWVALGHKDMFGNGPEDNDRQHEATSVAEVHKRKLKGGAKCGTDSFDGAESKPWAGETKVEGIKSVSKELSRPGAEVKYKVVGVDGANQNTTLTVCSPPSVQESVQAPTSSTLSVCIQSSLSANIPTNISAHLSTLVHHPFQCSLCDRSFSQRGSLNRHVRSHLGIRPFPCPRCPMTFSRQYRVMEHMRVHQRCVLGSDFQEHPAVSM